jgi:hypothetical protein
MAAWSGLSPGLSGGVPCPARLTTADVANIGLQLSQPPAGWPLTPRLAFVVSSIVRPSTFYHLVFSNFLPRFFKKKGSVARKGKTNSMGAGALGASDGRNSFLF